MSEPERVHKKNQATDAIYIRLKIRDVKVLDFDKMESVFKQSRDAMIGLQDQLDGG